MGVPPKPPGLIAFEGLFELYNRSSGLLPILSKRLSKTFSQNIFPKHPPKTFFQTNFLQTAYSHIINSYITDSPPTIYFTCTMRETCKGSNSFNI